MKNNKQLCGYMQNYIFLIYYIPQVHWTKQIENGQWYTDIWSHPMVELDRWKKNYFYNYFWTNFLIVALFMLQSWIFQQYICKLTRNGMKQRRLIVFVFLVNLSFNMCAFLLLQEELWQLGESYLGGVECPWIYHEAFWVP